MTEEFRPLLYCLSCAAEHAPELRLCRGCGARLEETPAQRRRGIALLLNELGSLTQEGLIEPETYYAVWDRLQAELQELTSDVVAPAPAGPPPPAPEPPKTAAAGPTREAPLFWVGAA